MPKLEFFLYALPVNPSGLDDPVEVILSGYRKSSSPCSVYPFGYATTFVLDERSRKLIGKSEVTVPNAELLQDDLSSFPIKPPKNAAQLTIDFNKRVAGTKR